MNILAYVKHEMSTDGYIWQVFNVPNDVDNVIQYLATRGYSTKEYNVQKNIRKAKPRTIRVKPISGGQHLADVWRRSVIIPSGTLAD